MGRTCASRCLHTLVCAPKFCSNFTANNCLAAAVPLFVFVGKCLFHIKHSNPKNQRILGLMPPKTSAAPPQSDESDSDFDDAPVKKPQKKTTKPVNRHKEGSKDPEEELQVSLSEYLKAAIKLKFLFRER